MIGLLTFIICAYRHLFNVEFSLEQTQLMGLVGATMAEVVIETTIYNILRKD